MNFCEQVGNGNPPVLDLNSPDSINEGLLSSTTLNNVLSPHTVDTNNKRHPSPYYYGDLFKYKSENASQIAAIKPFNVNNSNNKTISNQKTKTDRESKPQNNNKITSGKTKKFRKSSSLDNPIESKSKHGRSRSQIKYRKSSSVETQGTDSK